MSEPKVKFGKHVPKWLKQATVRWAKRLLPSDWALRLEMADTEMLVQQHGDGTRAVSISLPAYLDAAIWIADDYTEGEEAYRVLLHEIRHGHYQSITDIFAHAWDGRKKMTREQTAKLLEAKIEELIQRDVAIFLRAWKK